MSTKQFMLRPRLFYTLTLAIISLGNRLCQFCEYSKLLQIIIHFLITDDRKYLPVGENDISILCQYCTAMFVEVYPQSVRGLYCCKLYMVFLDIALTEIIYIRVPKSCPAAKEKHIAYPFQILFLCRDFNSGNLLSSSIVRNTIGFSGFLYRGLKRS